MDGPDAGRHELLLRLLLFLRELPGEQSGPDDPGGDADALEGLAAGDIRADQRGLRGRALDAVEVGSAADDALLDLPVLLRVRVLQVVVHLLGLVQFARFGPDEFGVVSGHRRLLRSVVAARHGPDAVAHQLVRLALAARLDVLHGLDMARIGRVQVSWMPLRILAHQRLGSPLVVLRVDLVGGGAPLLVGRHHLGVEVLSGVPQRFVHVLPGDRLSKGASADLLGDAVIDARVLRDGVPDILNLALHAAAGGFVGVRL